MLRTAQVPLGAIAHGRSGDKGNHANIAVIAYTRAGFHWLRQHLTAEMVASRFDLGPLQVTRYEAANLLAVNFVLRDVLAGGASRSLRSDTQGKTLALALLQMPVDLSEENEEMLRPHAKPEYTCPVCGKPMLLRSSRRGLFRGCSGYPECRATMPLPPQGEAP